MKSTLVLRNELNQEFKLRYREYFESKLATELLEKPESFPTVQKISKFILTQLIQHSDLVKQIIRDDKKIQNELTQPFFGSLYDANSLLDAEQIFQDIINTLTNKKINIKYAMQLHCIFEHRIFPKLSKLDTYENLSDAIPKELLSKENRSRVEKATLAQTQQQGISRLSFFAAKIPVTTTTHLRAVDKYELNAQSSFFKKANQCSIPSVCGPSGHTISLLTGAMQYGQLSADELKEYIFACFAFLTAGGNHSFYEVMEIGKYIGVKQASIAENVKSTEIFHQYENEFPQDYLEESVMQIKPV